MDTKKEQPLMIASRAIGQHERLAFAFWLVAMLHVFVILALSVSFFESKVMHKAFDVTLIESPNQGPAENARVKAQVAHRGQATKPSQTMPPSTPHNRASSKVTKPSKPTELTQVKRAQQVLHDLYALDAGQISQHFPKTSGLKRRTISASTFEARDALYLAQWRKKVERIGNLNYPTDEYNQGLHGQLRLLVAINQDGSLHEVKVLKSSGKQVLDNAAINIVKMASPFAPLPQEIRNDTDILEIVRTWQFLQGSHIVN